MKSFLGKKKLSPQQKSNQRPWILTAGIKHKLKLWQFRRGEHYHSKKKNYSFWTCFRGESSPVQQLITWVLRHGRAKRGSLTTAHRNTLMRDTGVENVRDPESCMRDRALCIWGQFSSCCLLGVDRK